MKRGANTLPISNKTCRSSLMITCPSGTTAPCPNARENGSLFLTISLVALEKGEYLGCVLLRLLEWWPMAAVVEEYQARVGNVVENGDAYLKGDHAVIPPMDEEHGRLNARERWCVVV